MSRPFARAALAALSAAALSIAVPAAAPAKLKAKPCTAKSQAAKRCAKAPKKPAKKPVAKVPVTVDLLDGSAATVDVPAIPLPGGIVLPGMPTSRTIPISGRLQGSMPGYFLGKVNTISLTGGTITPAPVDVLSDASCAGASVLRLNPGSTVGLDKAPSTGTIYPDGRVTATVNALLKLAFDSRTAAGCDSPLVTMGQSPTSLPVSLAGKIESGKGLSALTLDAPATPLSIAVCLTPGAPGAPCGTPPVAYPITIAVHAVVKVAIG